MELTHNGIKKQKWGVRNGPPYPLKPSQHTPAQKKANPGLNTLKEDTHKKKNISQQAKDYVKRKLRGELTYKEKEKIIKKGDIEKAQKYYKNFTKEEIDQLMDRNYAFNKLSSRKVKNDADAGQKAVDNYVNTMRTIGNVLESTIRVGKYAVEGYNLMANVNNAFNTDPESQMKIIFSGKKDKDKDKKGND